VLDVEFHCVRWGQTLVHTLTSLLQDVPPKFYSINVMWIYVEGVSEQSDEENIWARERERESE
jgi:hypothetical protein